MNFYFGRIAQQLRDKFYIRHVRPRDIKVFGVHSTGEDYLICKFISFMSST